jgi:protocatechuate 3,4-dioxygenase beta subunit
MPRRTHDVEERRGFIKSLGIFAVGCAAVPAGLACSGHQADAQSQQSSAIDIASPQEPGTRIQLSGTIFDPNGKPLRDVKMFLYHTDATGYYSRPINDPRQARLRGTLWTNAAGEYSFNTIKPAHYGDTSSPPAIHIHIHLQAPDGPEHWVESFYFQDDPRLAGEGRSQNREAGRFSNIVTLSSSDTGLLKGVRDFRIDPALAQRNRV